VRVLVVEDYKPLANSLTQALREAGYAVDVAYEGNEGLWFAESNPYDVIVLDLMLPGLDGISILKHLRDKNNQAGVLILTARDGLSDRVSGLDYGADDYLTKPFALDELLARVRAIVRRRYQINKGVIHIADLEVDTVKRTVRRNGATIELSGREYGLIEYLALRKGHVVTRSEIWEHVYDFNADPSSNVIDVYIGYLRKKIDQNHKVKLIHTRRGLGYVLGELQ